MDFALSLTPPNLERGRSCALPPSQLANFSMLSSIRTDCRGLYYPRFVESHAGAKSLWAETIALGCTKTSVDLLMQPALLHCGQPD